MQWGVKVSNVWHWVESHFPRRGGFAAFGLAVALILIALFVRLSMAPVSAGLQYVTFFPAVTLAVVIGGFWPGVLATLGGVLFATLLFTPPFDTFSLLNVRASFWSNLVFSFDGLIVCSSIEAMHRYHAKYLEELAEARLIAGNVEAINCALRDSEALSLSIFDSRPEPVAVLDENGVIKAVNRAWRQSAAANGAPDQLVRAVGLNYLRQCAAGPDQSNGALAGIRAVLSGRLSEFSLEYLCPSPSELRWFNMHVTPLLGEQRGAVVAHEDISLRKLMESNLRIAATAFEANEAIMITDAKNIIVRVNKAFAENTGYSAEEVIGQHVRLMQSNRQSPAFYAEMWKNIQRDGTWQGEIWNRRKNGEIYPVWLTVSAVKNPQGETTHYVGNHTDITTRKAAEDEIRHLAFYDPLTRLPNRRLLMDRLQQALITSNRLARRGALMFIDLDNFKTLNDTLGHDQGDLLLQQVALRVASCVREGDTVARLGGDEFVVVLENLDQRANEAASQAEAVGEKILAALNAMYFLNGHEFHCTSSLGISLFGDPDEALPELMKQADLAMYQAKAAGRNTLRFFDPAMQATVTAHVQLEKELRIALREGQFVPYYQAQVEGQGRLTGAEVLLRWQHPTRGLVFPDQFIALAEETGLIIPLGIWVLESACTQLLAWASRPETAELTLAVNVSTLQLRQANFVDEVLGVLQRSGANPQRLKLELTESLLMDNAEDTIRKMTLLKAAGIGFALDDFGTGYSSLAYLKRLPLEKLKIDRTFVMDVLIDSNDAAIAKTIVALARGLDLEVIAEGVETEEQRAFLARIGCHAYQGYFFGRPLPLAEFEQQFKG